MKEDVFDQLGIRLPCSACGKTYVVPLHDVALSHKICHEGCPVAQETECPPLFQTRLLKQATLDAFRSAWNDLQAQVRGEGEIVLMNNAGHADEMPAPRDAAATPPPKTKKTTYYSAPGPIRPPEVTSAPTLRFDLKQLERRLTSEPLQAGHTADTFAKYPDLRLVMIVLEAGSQLVEHRTVGRVSVQTLSGHIQVRAEGEILDLPAGTLVTFDSNVAHSVEAITDSTCLVTIAWPERKSYLKAG